MAEFTFQKDPRVYARGVARKVPERARVLGLDLSTHTGASFCDIIPGVPQESVKVYTELWDLTVGPYDTSMLRILRLRQFLTVVDPDLIMFEDVKHTPPQGEHGKFQMMVARAATTGEFFGMLKSAVALWATENDVPCQGCGIGEIKQYAMRKSGLVKKGVANKEDIIEACNTIFGTTFDPKTYEKTGVDNMADAAFVMLMGVDAYSEGLSIPFVLGETEPVPKPKRAKKKTK